MSDMRDYLIPRQLDAPPMALFVEADTATIAVAFIFLGLFIKQFIICALLGIFLARLYARSKAGGGRATIMTFLYWYAPSKILAQSRVQSHERYFLG
jgi:conjugal transfer pilus assembly protein TraL